MNRWNIPSCLLGLALAVAPGLRALAAEESDSITGRAVFDGKPPVQKPAVAQPPDPHCQKVHAKTPILKEDMPLVGKDGGLKNVFVYVKTGLPKDKKWPVPKKPVELKQEGCHYIPHVFGVMAGQGVKVVNADPTNHNIHGLPKENKEFNFSQAQKGMEKIVELNKTEDFKIKCDVHAWMNAHCFVMDHPFFAVTDAEGKFAIKGLPAGEYEVVLSHETLGEQTQKVKVEEGKATKVEDVKFKEKARRPTPKPK